MTSQVQKSIEQHNAEYTKNFSHGKLALPPAKGYLVVTCMDARIDPAAALGINLGDAHVIRNAGGNARDALRSIIISQQLLGTKEIVLVKHTDCGMVTFQNSDVHDKVKKNLGPSAEAEIGTLDFQPFPDAEQAVKNDVEYLRKSATVADDVVINGWIYDVHSGKVTKLV